MTAVAAAGAAERIARALTTVLAAGFLCGCGGAPPPSSRPVMLHSEDDDAPRAGRSCSIVGSNTLPGRATIAPPAVATLGESLAVAWVVRAAGSRQVRAQQLSHRFEPLGAAVDLFPDGEMPLNLGLAGCGSDLLVAWQLREPDGESIRISRLRAGDLRADGPLLVAVPRGVQPALDCAGDLGALVWSIRDRGLQDVFLRWVSPADGRLSEPLRLSGETDAAANPGLACTDDRCAVVWSDRRAIYSEVYATLIDAGGDAGATPVRVSEHDQSVSGAGGGYAPSVAVRGDGRFLVAWHDNRSRDESEIYATSLSHRGGAGRNHRVSRSPAPSTDAAVTSCGDDAGGVAWRDRRDGPPAVMFAALDSRGRRQSAAMTLSGAVDETSPPALVCVSDDTYAVAWTEASSETDGQGTLQLRLVGCR